MWSPAAGAGDKTRTGERQQIRSVLKSKRVKTCNLLIFYWKPKPKNQCWNGRFEIMYQNNRHRIKQYFIDEAWSKSTPSKIIQNNQLKMQEFR